jgi:hypothetical protein
MTKGVALDQGLDLAGLLGGGRQELTAVGPERKQMLDGDDGAGGDRHWANGHGLPVWVKPGTPPFWAFSLAGNDLESRHLGKAMEGFATEAKGLDGTEGGIPTQFAGGVGLGGSSKVSEGETQAVVGHLDAPILRPQMNGTACRLGIESILN